MTNTPPEKSGLPAWFLIVAIGGLVGIVLGAILFFGGSAAQVQPGVTATPTPAAGAPAVASTPRPNPATAGATPLGALPTDLAGWEKTIREAKPESYPALMDGVLRVSDEALRAQIAEKLLVTWLNADRETYLQYLDRLENSEDEGNNAWPVIVPAFVNAVPQLNEQAVAAPDLEEAIQWMTDYYAEQNPAAALEWARKWLLGDAQEAALATVAGQLSVTSLEQAEAVARGLQTPIARADAMANIGAELGRRDPKRALEWARGLKDENERAAAVEEVLWSMTDVDPAAAAQQVTQLNDPDLLQNVAASIGEALSDKDPNQAMQWAESVPAGPAREEALAGALAGWARKDPQAALSYFNQRHAQNADAAEAIFEEWAIDSPQAAASQAQQLSDAGVRQRAMVGAVNGWLNAADFDAVEQWVDQLPAGRDRDAASATVVDALSVEDPQSAWDRALTIKEAEIRQEAILSAFSGLAQRNPDGARAALNAPGITAEDRELLKPVLEAVPSTGAQIFSN